LKVGPCIGNGQSSDELSKDGIREGILYISRRLTATRFGNEVSQFEPGPQGITGSYTLAIEAHVLLADVEKSIPLKKSVMFYMLVSGESFRIPQQYIS
jgi:hypothetical protein